MTNKTTKVKNKKISLKIIRGLKRVNRKTLSILTNMENKRIWQALPECQELVELCKNPKYKTVFIFSPFLIWNMPAFQRPQQIATALAKNKDVLYIYCSSEPPVDKIDGKYKKISDNLVIATDFDFVLSIKHPNKIIHLYSTDISFDYKRVNKLAKRNKILYEYIDGIDESLLGKIPPYYLERHKKILENEKMYVVASADKLLKDVQEHRKKNYQMISNGVTLEDFKVTKKGIPEKLKPIKAKYKKIITYYGALASWFDYELLIKCAKRYPNYAFVLIGIDYDGSLKKSKIDKYENIINLGKVNYTELVNYSANSDLLTIPFKINHITESTSPVKLFEYMAVKKPILTTAMPECRKYKSVVIGEDHEDYINKIEYALKLVNDKKYINEEVKEAQMNSWDKKASKIIKLVNEGEDYEKSI